jgi:hypothetical protein
MIEICLFWPPRGRLKNPLPQLAVRAGYRQPDSESDKGKHSAPSTNNIDLILISFQNPLYFVSGCPILFSDDWH